MVEAERSPVPGALGDYLAAIYVLSRSKPTVRITDISVYLNISKPSVNRAVNNLSKQGLVEHKPYGSISLTDAGRDAGAEVCARNDIIRRFLTETLMVPEARAKIEASYIERGVSRDTIDKMEELIGGKKA